MRPSRAIQPGSLFLSLALLVFVLPNAGAASSLTAAQKEAIATLESAITEGMSRDLTPGLAVALVGSDGALWQKGFGLADVEAERAVTVDTPFMLASVSKTFIAAALMSEQEAGRLRLDQPINELLPFPVENPRVRGEQIEVIHLAAHTSGIRDHEATYEGSYAPGDPKIGLESWLRQYLTPRGAYYKRRGNFLKAMPGERWEYSNIASALAALVTESSSGLSYRELLRTRFFEPLGMRNTAFNLSEFEEDVVAVPYDGEPGNFTPREHYGLPTYPDGQLRASVADLSRYLAMMINEGTFGGQRVLSADSVRRIREELRPDRGEIRGTSQALFWHLRFGNSMLAHGGGDYGMSTFLFFVPQRKMGGVVLMNSQSDGAQEMMVICLQALTNAMEAFRDE